MTTAQSEIVISDWQGRGSGQYRFFGTYPEGGFWADARLEHDEIWRARIEQTNYLGDVDRLAAVIAGYAESM
jgi:hypothetical protein